MGLPIAILAGGLGTRLYPITQKIPKALVAANGIPFLSYQLDLLKKNRIFEIVLCVGHLGEMIVEEFKDGRKYGVHIQYSFDGENLQGTGGAIRNALPLLGPDFFVMYGDSYLPINFQQVADAYKRNNYPALMTVFANAGQYDKSNVWFENGEIMVYDKQKPLPEMHHIDYGLSILSAKVFDSLSKEGVLDLADIFRNLVQNRNLFGFEVAQRFYEIGSASGLAEFEAYIKGLNQ